MTRLDEDSTPIYAPPSTCTRWSGMACNQRQWSTACSGRCGVAIGMVCLQVSGSDDVFKGMARTLECFKAWLDGGNGGPSWSLESENYEGWRVVVDEGEWQTLPLLCSCRSRSDQHLCGRSTAQQPLTAHLIRIRLGHEG